jgi:hypothetical protein
MLLAPALALPLVVGSASTASADSTTRTDVTGARLLAGAGVPQGFSRTWV